MTTDDLHAHFVARLRRKGLNAQADRLEELGPDATAKFLDEAVKKLASDIEAGSLSHYGTKSPSELGLDDDGEML